MYVRLIADLNTVRITVIYVIIHPNKPYVPVSCSQVKTNFERTSLEGKHEFEFFLVHCRKELIRLPVDYPHKRVGPFRLLSLSQQLLPRFSRTDS
jgi:hypothetical protein